MYKTPKEYENQIAERRTEWIAALNGMVEGVLEEMLKCLLPHSEMTSHLDLINDNDYLLATLSTAEIIGTIESIQSLIYELIKECTDPDSIIMYPNREMTIKEKKDFLSNIQKGGSESSVIVSLGLDKFKLTGLELEEILGTDPSKKGA